MKWRSHLVSYFLFWRRERSGAGSCDAGQAFESAGLVADASTVVCAWLGDGGGGAAGESGEQREWLML